MGLLRRRKPAQSNISWQEVFEILMDFSYQGATFRAFSPDGLVYDIIMRFEAPDNYRSGERTLTITEADKVRLQTEQDVVLAVKELIRYSAVHEAMEKTIFRGRRIFDPHGNYEIMPASSETTQDRGEPHSGTSDSLPTAGA